MMNENKKENLEVNEEALNQVAGGEIESSNIVGYQYAPGMRKQASASLPDLEYVKIPD